MPVQQGLAIKELKGRTSSLLLPEALLDIWPTCGGHLTPRHAILGPHAPFTFVSMKEAADIAGQVMTRADHTILKNPGDVSEAEVANEQVQNPSV